MLKANNKEKTGLVSALVITQERDAREKEQKEIGSMQFSTTHNIRVCEHHRYNNSNSLITAHLYFSAFFVMRSIDFYVRSTHACMAVNIKTIAKH